MIMEENNKSFGRAVDDALELASFRLPEDCSTSVESAAFTMKKASEILEKVLALSARMRVSDDGVLVAPIPSAPTQVCRPLVDQGYPLAVDVRLRPFRIHSLEVFILDSMRPTKTLSHTLFFCCSSGNSGPLPAR